ncbi:MAG: hypothetical protein IGBAC_1056 [Ignavibacteriae bacterium]|nr:MAG: hypothetical protein IGBAC_1056 [Ignavibacteriota bacterium]
MVLFPVISDENVFVKLSGTGKKNNIMKNNTIPVIKPILAL